MYICGCVTKDSYGVGSLVLLGRQTKKHKKCLCGQTETQRKWLAKKPRRSGQHGAVDNVEEEKVGEVNDLVLLEMLFRQA